MKFPLWLLIFLSPDAALWAGEPACTFDFTTQPRGEALPWLREHGFEEILQFAELHPRFEDGAFWLSTDHPEVGLCGYSFPKERALAGVKRVRLTWGVAKLPDGADWGHGNNRTPLGVMISFGYERLPSGLPLSINAAPYFICPFFGTHEPEGKVYVGRYWKPSGRYVAVKPGKAGAAVVSEIELDHLFRTQFDKSQTPPVSAVAIQMNTKDTTGAAAAFVRKIDFFRE